MPSHSARPLGWSPPANGGKGGGKSPPTGSKPGKGSLGPPLPKSSKVIKRSSHPTPSSGTKANKKQRPGWVARPRNAFIIFRCDYSQIHRRKGRRIRLPPGTYSTTPSLSRRAALAWKDMSLEEKEPYRIRADQERITHQQKHPDYRFRPRRKNGARPETRCESSSSPASASDTDTCPPAQSTVSYRPPSTAAAVSSFMSFPSSTADGFPSGSGPSQLQPVSRASTRWISPISCNISAVPPDSVGIPTELGPTAPSPYIFVESSSTTTGPAHYASTQTQPSQDAGASVLPLTTARTQLPSNTFASPADTIEGFCPSSTYPPCGGQYQVPQYAQYDHLQYHVPTEAIWYGLASSYLEPTASGHATMNTMYDYSAPKDDPNSFNIF